MTFQIGISNYLNQERSLAISYIEGSGTSWLQLHSELVEE